VSNTVSNLYAGPPRRAPHHVHAADVARPRCATKGITHALVVPTMLARVVEYLDEIGVPNAAVPTLRSLAYGGARCPRRIIERRTRAVPRDRLRERVRAHRDQLDGRRCSVPTTTGSRPRATTPAVRARLGSAGVLVPGIEAEIRDADGNVLGVGRGRRALRARRAGLRRYLNRGRRRRRRGLVRNP
jgi:acyl-CoA synthetase (AMP-forming)/AMP-acid ligase II